MPGPCWAIYAAIATSAGCAVADVGSADRAHMSQLARPPAQRAKDIKFVQRLIVKAAVDNLALWSVLCMAPVAWSTYRSHRVCESVFLLL